ncbi:hypothetical protein HDU93_008546 [Gonapodya sp. JEL0774]|nr:hypothetical protein HDU93_008546 [Gonapodya sp. JEL0774]
MIQEAYPAPITAPAKTVYRLPTLTRHHRDDMLAASTLGHSAEQGPSYDAWAEFTNTFLVFLRAEENNNLPLANYLHFQPEVNSQMRRTLIQWLIDIKEQLGLHSHTLALAVSNMDRYLSKRSIPTRDFQLLGIVSLFVASKYQDLPKRALTVSRVRELCCNEYTRGDIFEMERRLLAVIDFDLSWIGPHAVLDVITGRVIEQNYGMDERSGGISSSSSALAPTSQLPSSSPSQHESLFTPVDLPPILTRLAHDMLELSVLYSRFIGLTSTVLAVGSIVAADRVLMLSQQTTTTLLTPASLFQLMSLIDPSDSVLPDVAYHLANISVSSGLVTLPPTPNIQSFAPSSVPFGADLGQPDTSHSNEENEMDVIEPSDDYQTHYGYSETEPNHPW